VEENPAKALGKRKADEIPAAAVVPPSKVQKLSPEEMTATAVDGGRTSSACNASILSTSEAAGSAASTAERVVSALEDRPVSADRNIECGEEIAVADPTRAGQGDGEALDTPLCRLQLPVGEAEPRIDDANPPDLGANLTGVDLDFRSEAAGQDSVDLALARKPREELPIPVAAHDPNVEVEGGDDQSVEASLEASKSRNSNEVVGPDNSAVVAYRVGAAESTPPAQPPAQVQAPARQHTEVIQRKTYNFTRAAILSSHPLLIARPSSTEPTPPMSPEQIEEARERDRALRGEYVRIELEIARRLASSGSQGPFHVGDYLVNIDPANGHPRLQGLRHEVRAKQTPRG